MLRLTRPRLEVLAVLYRVGGRIRDAEGRAVTRLARALHYSGSLTSLRRVLSALHNNGLITCEARDGRVHIIELTSDGAQLLRDRGQVDGSVRRFLLDEHVSADPELLVLAASTVGGRLQDWARRADTSRSRDELRFEATLALHHDIAPRRPDDEELAVLVARTRVSLGNLLDAYLTDPSTVGAPAVQSGLKTVLDVHLALVAWRRALTSAEPAGAA